MSIIRKKSRMQMPEAMSSERSLPLAMDVTRASRKKMYKGGMAKPQGVKEDPHHSMDDSCTTCSGMCMMADGGQVPERTRADNDSAAPSMPMAKPDNRRLPEDEYMSPKWSNGNPPPRKPDDERLPQDEYMANHFADGGQIDEEMPRPKSMAQAIMRKRKMMAEGGSVDIGSNGKEDPANPNGYDDQNEEAGLKELYDDSQLMSDPMDSNEHGDILEDEDKDDGRMVSSIRKKLMSRRS